MSHITIAGQLNAEERSIISKVILQRKPESVIEVGTWFGGGSTLEILSALEQNGIGHLWGIESDRTTYTQMLHNIQTALPTAAKRFTPLFGFSDFVIPRLFAESG